MEMVGKSFLKKDISLKPTVLYDTLTCLQILLFIPNSCYFINLIFAQQFCLALTYQLIEFPDLFIFNRQ